MGIEPRTERIEGFDMAAMRTKRKTIRFWLRYVREKRNVVLLYFLTAFLYTLIGSLYHFENFSKLLYAGLLTSVIWMGAGIWDGWRYVRKTRQAEALENHYRQSGDLPLKEFTDGYVDEGEREMGDAESYEEVLMHMLSLIFHEKETERRRWEEKTAECRDYYVMWTHQIKTPISAMRLLLENGEFQGRNAFLMKEELFKTEQYAEMALTFQRLESMASDMVLQEYDLQGLLKKAVKKYAVLFINRGLSLELQEMALRVVTDEKWLGFCIEQLLSNSIKYTEKGRIVIWAEADQSKPLKKAALYIEDTGIGICPEDLPRIFERGFTGYNGRLDKKSTGIGLYLCRKIFAHLGVSVSVESQEGKGTRVRLLLPCRESYLPIR